MAPHLDISIPTTTTGTSPKPHTLYTINLHQPLRSTTLQKRYSDFTTLHASLTSQSSNFPPPLPLPPKTWLKSTVSDASLAESRRQALEAYLRAINNAEDPRWRNTAAWRTFLNLPNDSGGAAVTAKMKGARDAEAPVADPGLWLDVHREVKTLLRDVRVWLARRDQASAAQSQHEAGVEAKRGLVKAGMMVGGLEKGLALMSGASGDVRMGTARRKGEDGDGYVAPRLGEGEVRRRRDLISAAKKERQDLEDVFNSYTTRSGTSSADTAAATVGDREGLFKNSNGSSHPAAGARRVLGAPVKETQRTRELDNAGVLQLQQQLMAEQDQDLGDLTKVVARMKEMGVQIGEEVHLQNEMLKMVDTDVDRVTDKVAIAKKRVGKIS